VHRRKDQRGGARVSAKGGKRCGLDECTCDDPREPADVGHEHVPPPPRPALVGSGHVRPTFRLSPQLLIAEDRSPAVGGPPSQVLRSSAGGGGPLSRLFRFLFAEDFSGELRLPTEPKCSVDNLKDRG